MGARHLRAADTRNHRERDAGEPKHLATTNVELTKKTHATSRVMGVLEQE
jgi:hypothetical protein